MRPVFVLSSALLLLGLSARSPTESIQRDETLALPRPAVLRGLFAGQLQLIADYYWLLTINRVGAATTAEELQRVYPYADLVTDLDPEFEYAYRFGAITLPVQTADGQIANLREAEKLLRKGLQQFPGSRRLLFQLAFNYMYYEGRYQEAADIFQQLARDPMAPKWYAALATRLYAAGGDLDTSAYLTQQLLETCIDPELCENYERRLVEIEQERLLRAIDDAVTRFVASRNRHPQDFAELTGAGLLTGLPPDPFGGEYYLDEEGRARSTATKHRLEFIRDARDTVIPGSPSVP